MKRRGLRDRWEVEVFRSDLIGDGCKLLLLALARQMTDAGSVSVPREQLAAKIRKHPSRVTAYIAEAKDAGLLDQTGPGNRGRTASYVAVLPTGKVTDVESPLTAKGDGSAVTFSSHLSDGAQHPELVKKVTDWQSPNAGAHVRVSYERRETNPNHDDSRDSLNAEHEQPRSNGKPGRRLALTAAAPIRRPQAVA